MGEADAYGVMTLGYPAAQIVCGNETIKVFRSSRVAAYHPRQLASSPEYVDRHRPLGTRILTVPGADLSESSPTGTVALPTRDVRSRCPTTIVLQIAQPREH